jgi:hypothetical protein
MPAYVYGVVATIGGRDARTVVDRGARVVDITTRRSLAVVPPALDSAPLDTHRFTVPTGIDVGNVTRAISVIVVQSMKMITPEQ